MLDVELWAELRREHFVRGVSIKKLARRTGLSRNTIRKALRSDEPPAYRRAPAGSMLDPFKDEIHRLLKDDPTLSGVRVREELEPLGFAGGKTIVDDYLREVRPFFLPPRTLPADGVSAGGDLPVGSVAAQPRDPGRPRPDPAGLCRVLRAGVLARRRGRADLQQGGGRHPVGDGALPALVRRGATDAGVGSGGRDARWRRPSDPELAGFCGQLRCGWRILDPGDCQAKGVVERLQGYAETNFEPGRSFANQLDFQFQLDAWFAKANARTHRALRCRPIDRLADDVAAMITAPERWPEPTAGG